MSECKLNHSEADIKLKIEQQRKFLPEDVLNGLKQFTAMESRQEQLNEVFHLLKKYDLSSKEEQEKRNQLFLQIFKETL
ncbi:group-specific protein [Bacillus sp. MUM 13]|uniref:group-specific protein n=1 Tax=Bacillus sp. MUM 13 TaxID=1678001 RepID=UPI0008F5B79B|nr:group-specific protein [Bacillus sp. MUM 13]OIK13598.1 group-specific protein [Bacillus sp. MUM 13]